MRYLELAELYQKLEKTSKRLEKTHLISVFLKEIPNEELSRICLLLQGRLFLAASEEKIGVASKLILKAINVATGVEQTKIEKEWKKTGDLGVTIEELCGKKRQQTLASSVLTVKKVFENLQKLAEMEGEGTVDKKVKLIAELLSQATPGEARYIVRTVLEDLRVGVGDGTLRDAIVWAFFNQEVKINYNQEAKSIEPENREQYNALLASAQKAYDLTTDWGYVAVQAKEKGLGGLKKITLTIGNPTKVMLCQKAKDMEEAFEMVGKPAAFEFKYDGFRLLVHKKGDQIWLFTRRLENVSKQFPEVVKYIKEGIKAEVVVLDSEAVGYDAKTGRYLPFQNISQRIKRKYNIEQMAHDFPVELNVFDVLVYGNEHQNENLMNTPYQERRKLLEKIVKEQPKKLRLAKQLVTGDLKKAQAFYDSAVQSGEEGLIAKNLESIYKPGSRVGFQVKIKPVMETLDLVIVGAEWGEGKRKGWLSSFTVACYDKKKDEFLEIGQVGTGIKELESEEEEKSTSWVTFEELTELLKPLVLSEKGQTVKTKPKIVIEVNYEEIQKSPTYSSGYALRFPRLVRLRVDKGPDDASTLKQVERLYEGQRGRK